MQSILNLNLLQPPLKQNLTLIKLESLSAFYASKIQRVSALQSAHTL